MQFLGPNLEYLMKKCGGRFTLKTTAIIALQLIDRIETMQSHKFIHRDIKPENFLIGLNQESGLIYLIDFGLSK